MATQYNKVLIVDDEAPFRRIIARNLEARGCSVQEAETAEEALEQIASDTPDLILLDINLPGKNGWEVLRELRAQGIAIPTVIVSAVRCSPERLAEFQPLRYLPKPFPLEALLGIIEGRSGDDQSFATTTSEHAQREQSLEETG
jgi:CheY-like chemotaxis protein